MDVKILTNTKPLVSVPKFSTYRSSSSFALKTKCEPALNKTCINHCVATKMLITERPPAKKNSTRKIQEDSVLSKRYSELAAASSSHFYTATNAKPHSEDISEKASTKAYSSGSKRKSNSLLTLKEASRHRHHHSEVARCNASSQQSTSCTPASENEGLLEKSNEVFSKSRHKRSGKRRTNSRKKKRHKSSGSKRKGSKQGCKHRDDLMLPVRKELSSCFTVYTSEIASNKPNLDKSGTCINLRSTASTIVGYRTEGSRSSYGYRQTSDVNQRRSSAELALPPRIGESVNQNQLKPAVDRLHNYRNLDRSPYRQPKRNACWSMPDARQSTVSAIMSSTKRKEGILLPPTPTVKLSQITSLPDKLNKAEQRKAIIQVYGGKTFGVVNEKEWKKTGKTLSDRLNLIHHYGNNYQLITEQIEKEQKRTEFRKQQAAKVLEKEQLDQQKQEQRKRIYALNKLMTTLEQNQFNNFMKTLKDSQD
ncbi:uncharacterized protein LOC143450673 [Clavelina lepadiformis]|uniref:uncharacterized protein LOC143450673 n=1 Tax=Clavelina lepadiformis TaxID=159417 RepID=UPI0040433A0C